MRQTILAVDDEPHMLRLMERIIKEKTPFQITTTSNSLEVPEILEKRAFDLIILDLRMPGVGGLDLLRLVKEKERFEEVIIITAFGSLETAIEALSLGVFDYITKPFKKEQILSAIHRAMRSQHMKREAARIAEMFNLEPWAKAQEAFEREYLIRLLERCDGHLATAAERSGLPLDRVVAVQREKESEAR